VPKNGGTGAVKFLIEHFTFLGFEVQNWMLVVVGLIAAYMLLVWMSRDRI
jgi:nitrate reductase NapE component